MSQSLCTASWVLSPTRVLLLFGINSVQSHRSKALTTLIQNGHICRNVSFMICQPTESSARCAFAFMAKTASLICKAWRSGAVWLWAHVGRGADLWCFGALADLPTLHLVVSCREEVYQLNGPESCRDDLGQRACCLILQARIYR